MKQIDKLFYPLPSHNEIAISVDGQWIAISEDNTVHLWRTTEISMRERKPVQSLQLAESVAAMLFAQATNELIVLSPSGLHKVQYQPRAMVVTRAYESERFEPDESANADRGMLDVKPNNNSIREDWHH